MYYFLKIFLILLKLMRIWKPQTSYSNLSKREIIGTIDTLYGQPTRCFIETNLSSCLR